MPTVSEAAKRFLKRKIEKNINEGKPQDQAVAIAHTQAQQKGFDVPKKKKNSLSKQVNKMRD